MSVNVVVPDLVPAALTKPQSNKQRQSCARGISLSVLVQLLPKFSWPCPSDIELVG